MKIRRVVTGHKAEGEVHLHAGDVIIQRATMHNWVNRGTEPCIIVFVLITLKGGKDS